MSTGPISYEYQHDTPIEYKAKRNVRNEIVEYIKTKKQTKRTHNECMNDALVTEKIYTIDDILKGKKFGVSKKTT